MLLRRGFPNCYVRINGGGRVTFDAKVRVLGDFVEVTVRVNDDCLVLQSGGSDQEIGESRRFAFSPKREAQSGCRVP